MNSPNLTGEYFLGIFLYLYGYVTLLLKKGAAYIIILFKQIKMIMQRVTKSLQAIVFAQFNSRHSALFLNICNHTKNVVLWAKP